MSLIVLLVSTKCLVNDDTQTASPPPVGAPESARNRVSKTVPS